MLLYAALVHRTFGARASTSTARSDRATLGRRMSSLDFFRNYPTLHPLLLGQLRSCLESDQLKVSVRTVFLRGSGALRCLCRPLRAFC